MAVLIIRAPRCGRARPDISPTQLRHNVYAYVVVRDA